MFSLSGLTLLHLRVEHGREDGGGCRQHRPVHREPRLAADDLDVRKSAVTPDLPRDLLRVAYL